MYVQRNIQWSSRNHVCRGKATGITYSECVFLALVIQHAVRMRRIVLSSVTLPAVLFFHIFSQTARFSKKKYLT
jgi:hypothetical protein